MAAALFLGNLEQELTCAVCLSIYTDPVVLECKHSFCRACIEEFWSGATPGTYSCPECSTETSQRAILEKNFKLASIVQKYLALQSSQDVVLCNYCTESPLPAVKTCLKCEASLCPIHLKHHRENSVFKSHSLIELTTDLSLWKCPEHQEPLKIYCKDDKVCICSLCALVGKHKSHNCSSVSEGEKELRDHLQSQVENIRNNIEAVEEALKLHHKEKQNTENKIQETKRKVKEKYKLLKESVEEEEREILGRLEDAQKCVTAQTNAKILQLENQVKEFETSLTALTSVLKKNEELVFIRDFNSMADRMKNLSQQFIPWKNTSDIDEAFQQKLAAWAQKLDSVSSVPWNANHRDFLVTLYGQTPGSNRGYFFTNDKMNSGMYSNVGFGQDSSISGIQSGIQSGFGMGLENYQMKSGMYSNVGFGQYSSISGIQSGIQYEFGMGLKNYQMNSGMNPGIVQRSDGWEQFVCKQAVSCGRSYWEVQIDVQCRGNVGYMAVVIPRWGVGVCYQSPDGRSGTEWSIKGKGPVEAKTSWILDLSSGSLTAQHNGTESKAMAQIPSRVGVFVDFEAGIVSFYSVSDNNLILLHTFKEQRFPDPLYPSLWVSDCDITLTFCNLN